MILLWCDLLVTNMDIHNAKSNESSKEVYAHLRHQLHWALLHQSLECMSGASTCRLMRWLFAQHVSRLVVASHISKPQAHWTILVIFVLIVAQIMHKCLCKNEGSIYIYIYIRMEGSSFHNTNGWSVKSWAFLEQLYAYFQALSLLSTSTCSNAIPFSCIYWVLWNSGGWVGLSRKEIFVQLSFLTWCFLIWVCPRSKKLQPQLSTY